MKNFYFVLAMSLSFFLSAQSASTFINEISYTASNPSERGFEIAGQAGSNLDGWQMISYNVAGMQRNVTDLSGKIIPNQQNGYGTIWYDVDQGGNGGGLALVDATGIVQHFVAYGSAHVNGLLAGAGNGPASGLQPEYAGTSLPGASLQLIGSGTTGPTFSWALDQLPSVGGVNANQTFISYFALTSSNTNTANINPLGRNRGSASPSFRAFPNPVQTQLQLTIPASTTPDDHRFLLLYNQQGQQVIRLAIGNDYQEQQLDLQDLTPGAYYLVVNSRQGNWQEKIIVE